MQELQPLLGEEGVLSGEAVSNRAAGIWRQLASEGDVAAQYQLGRAHEYGLGVIADDAEALVWYHKAAASQNINA